MEVEGVMDLTCDDVDSAIGSEEALLSNTETSTICSDCGVVVPDNILEQHIMLHVSGESKEVACPYCSASVPQHSFHLHLQAHLNVLDGEQQMGRCPLCSLHFKYRKVMFDHVMSVHLKQQQGVPEQVVFSCDYCTVPYPNITGKLVHERVCRSKPGARCHTKPSVPETWDALEPMTKFSCRVCRISFRDEKALYEHSKSHANSVNGVSPVDLQCGCNKTFKNARNLRRHQQSCKGEQTNNTPSVSPAAAIDLSASSTDANNRLQTEILDTSRMLWNQLEEGLKSGDYVVAQQYHELMGALIKGGAESRALAENNT